MTTLPPTRHWLMEADASWLQSATACASSGFAWTSLVNFCASVCNSCRRLRRSSQ